MERKQGALGPRWCWLVASGLALACSGRKISAQPTGSGGGRADGSANDGSANGGSADAGGMESGATSGGSNRDARAGSSSDASADSSAGNGNPGQATSSHELDLLLVVDNSESMLDKQDVLKAIVPDLVMRITDVGSGITDLHVGVITTSLGDHGAGTVCPSPGATAIVAEENNDNAHLLGTRPRAASLGIPSGFVSWTTGQSTSAVTAQIQGLIGAADQQGCGFEATLESMYRFLVDPAPPASIVLMPCPALPSEQCATSSGPDQVILDQRKAFLRPDSTVGIVVLSDENDCSVRDEQQGYLLAESSFTIPNGTDPCATDPNDPCCYSCDMAPPANCPAASTYAACGSTAPANDSPTDFNLRCWNDKGRFGVDFLYPVARYVNALTKPELCTTRDDLDASKCSSAVVKNPLFAPAVDGGTGRDPSLVFLLGIVGVPWQDIQTKVDPSGNAYPATEVHFKVPTAMATDGTWDLILGNPGSSPPVPPTDPLMLESTTPRTGADPTASVGALVAPNNAPRFGMSGANPANGHEWFDYEGDDLEYVCIFSLPSSDSESTETADCGSDRRTDDDNPLCQNPDGSYGTTEYFAKGYPGLRELSVIHGLGKNGLASSICSRNVTGLEAEDYGYRPAALSLIAALKSAVPRAPAAASDASPPHD